MLGSLSVTIPKNFVDNFPVDPPMDIQAYLKDFKGDFDPRLEAYLDARIKETRVEDELVAEALEHVKVMTLAGGKRLRPAFMLAGYESANGVERERLLQTAIAIELIHMFLLIHDDIIDRDTLRHGVATLHERYADWGRRKLGLTDPAHFGNSIALIVGDLLFSLGNDIIFRSGFPYERVFEALSKTQKIVSHTSVGEAKDIYLEYRKRASSEEVLKMYEQKTARYTFEGPLHLGAILAGGSAELLQALSAYSLPLGIAFQIQDDILGIYGNEERIGKPVGSDIEEGKMTILVTKAYELPGNHHAELSEILEKGASLTADDVERFRALIRESGSLEEAKNLAHTSIHAAKQALEGVSLPEPTKTFLLGIADYMLAREY